MAATRRSSIHVRALILAIVAVSCCCAANGQELKGDQPSKAVERYQKWLNEDVRWIITPAERTAFLKLHTDNERDRFIEQFWLRRDPTPSTARNEFKEEHYRRLAYANTHFTSTVPGWKTDRGRTYITLGPPYSITASEIGSGNAHPTEVWVYRFLEGIGTNVNFTFVDLCDCGDYRGQPVQVKGGGNLP